MRRHSGRESLALPRRQRRLDVPVDESSADLLERATLRLVERVFVGSEALARGVLTRHELRTFYRRVLPDVYAPKRSVLTLEDRTVAAWLWSGREGVVKGLAASAMLAAISSAVQPASAASVCHRVARSATP